jgi:NitT/TauT family transport system permease protein
MTTEQSLPLTPGQKSDMEAAAEQVYVEAADEMLSQNTGLDMAALLAIGTIIILFHILVPEYRDTVQIAQAVRNESLRRVLTVVLGLLSLAVFVGERDSRQANRNRAQADPLRLVAGGILALYTTYVAAFTFFGLEILPGTPAPMIAEFAALISIVILWRPWERTTVYRRAFNKLALPVAIFFSVLILWELMVSVFDIKAFLLPKPSVIFSTFSGIYPRLISQGWVTFQNAFWGFALGCGAGILYSIVSARFIGFNRALMPYAIAINAVPIIAFAPITNQWFGLLNPMSKISIVAILAFFPTMINTMRGLTSADVSSLELMRSYAASELETFRKVRFPFALPYIFNSLKVATALSMITAIVAEYFGGPTTGLGVNIKDHATLSKFPLVWSEIIVASVLGITFYFVVSLIERLVMPWHISFRGEND